MKRKPTFAPYIGTVTYGVPDNAIETIDILSSALGSLLRRCRVDRETRKAHVAVLRAVNGDDTLETEQSTLTLLTDALSHYAPPYTYFGERDGDYGFWPQFKEAVADGELQKIDQDDAAIRDFWGREDVLLVNDHGNVECGRFDKRGRFHSYWSAV